MSKSVADDVRARVLDEAVNQDKDEGSSFGKWILSEEALKEFGLTEWKPDEGANYIQLLPAEDINPNETQLTDSIVKKTNIALPVYLHWNIGGNSFICRRMMLGKACPICEEFQRRRNLKEEWDAIKHLYMGKHPNRWVFYVVDVSEPEKVDEGVKVFASPPTIKREIFGRMIEKSRSGEKLRVKFLPTDPKETRIFSFERNGTGVEGTNYSEYQYCDPEDESGKPEDLPKEFYTNPSFDKLLYIPTYEEVKEALLGTTPDVTDVKEDLETQITAAEDKWAEDKPEPETVEEELEETPRRIRRRRG